MEKNYLESTSLYIAQKIIAHTRESNLQNYLKSSHLSEAGVEHFQVWGGGTSTSATVYKK